MPTGTLALKIVDVRGVGIHDDVRIELTNLDGSQRYQSDVFIEQSVHISGIECGTAARYQVTVWPSDYRMSQFFVQIRAGQITDRPALVVPVNSASVMDISAPSYDNLDVRLQQMLQWTVDVLPGKQGEPLYDALDPVRKACLLNIAAKAAATRLLDGSTCLDHLGGLVKLRADRFFARTKGALREEAKNAKLVFQPAPDTLHHAPDGYTHAGSVKTLDRYGNLQLSFFRRGTTGDDYLVDVDIDEASGIEHGFEVVRNAVADHTTNPYDVRDILIRHQLLDPGYGFKFAGEVQVVRFASA